MYGLFRDKRILPFEVNDGRKVEACGGDVQESPGVDEILPTVRISEDESKGGNGEMGGEETKNPQTGEPERND